MWQNIKKKLQMWQKSEYDKTKNVTKLKTQNLTIQNAKTKNMKKFKKVKHETWNVTNLNNSKCDKTQKLKMWQK